jgi:hypothetical protein
VQMDVLQSLRVGGRRVVNGGGKRDGAVDVGKHQKGTSRSRLLEKWG